jgi:hypothetical protein
LASNPDGIAARRGDTKGKIERSPYDRGQRIRGRHDEPRFEPSGVFGLKDNGAGERANEQAAIAARRSSSKASGSSIVALQRLGLRLASLCLCRWGHASKIFLTRRRWASYDRSAW